MRRGEEIGDKDKDKGGGQGGEDGMRGEREQGTVGEEEKRVSQVIRKEERNTGAEYC